MPRRFNKERLKAFIARRRINTLGLTIITAASAIITLICALSGFARTDVLAVVTALLVVLCFIQAFKMRRSFRTIPSFRGKNNRKKHID